MSRRVRNRALAALAAAALLAGGPLAAWEIDATAPRAELEAFHRAFAAAVYPYPGHGAAPLGIAGWRLSAGLALAPDFEDEAGAAAVVRGNLTGGYLTTARAGLSKGLPGGFDVGLAYARVLEGDVDLLSGELQWNFVEGGAVSPALAVRATATRSSGSRAYDLDLYGLEVLVSKGFAVLSVYGGAGLVRSEGRFSPAAGPALSVHESGEILYAGLVLLSLPKIHLELQSGEQITGTVSVSVGF